MAASLLDCAQIGLRQSIAVTAVALATALPASGEVTLDADALRNAASLAIEQGDARRAGAYADALLTRDAKDISAHLIRARALRDLGKLKAARASARAAWQLADTDGEKYAAATITAQVLSTQGKRTRAQLWLRRAIEHAPSKGAKAQAARDFRYVRQQNKWQTQVGLTLAPNSNINNGSASDRSELNYVVTDLLFGEPVEFELSGASRALSGLEFGANVQSRYRFKQTATTAHDLKFTLSYRSFILSDSAKALAPDVSGSDFAFGTVGLGYGYRKLNFDRKGEFALDLSAGQSWYGGARYASFVRTTVAQSYRQDKQTSLRFAFDAEHQNGQRTVSTDTFKLSASVNRRFASGDVGYLQFGVSSTSSQSQDSEYGEVELRSGYILGKPIMGAAVQFGLGASYRDYDTSVHSRDGRQDFKVFADVTATFKDIDYYGFNPSVSLSASTTNSNIGLFTSDRFGLNIGIRSAF